MPTTKITPAPLTRSLGAIAEEIGELWPKVREAGTPSSFGNIGQHPANPYWQAMAVLRNLDGHYYDDPATDVVRRFLSNASGFRGDRAREIKAELEAALADHAERRRKTNPTAARLARGRIRRAN